MSDERRGSTRLSAYLPGELLAADWQATVSITRDVSAGGLLVFSSILVDVGTPVKLRVSFEGKVLVIEGKVLRAQRLPPDDPSVWRTTLAIESAPADPALAELYAALAR